jgi:UDP-N-acetylglucosamine acyltransferase
MAKIHPTAMVDSSAELADGVTVDAYCIIRGPVQIGSGTIIHPHTQLQGRTRIGEHCEIGPAAYVGLPPQHLRADPNVGELVIGNHVIIRETATVHRSTHPGKDGATRVGDNTFLMGGVHIGHDCVLGQSVILANSVLLGGHCQIADQAFLGGGATLHQFVRVGRLAIIGGNEAVFRCIHQHRVTENALDEIRLTVPDLPEVRELLEFIRTARRGIVPSSGGRRQVFDEAIE